MFDSLFSICSTRECSFQGAEESVKDEARTGRLSSSFLTLHSVQTSKQNFVSDFSITTVESTIQNGARLKCTVPTSPVRAVWPDNAAGSFIYSQGRSVLRDHLSPYLTICCCNAYVYKSGIMLYPIVVVEYDIALLLHWVSIRGLG